MPNPHDKVQILLEWCANNSIIIDERISIGIDSQTGIAVFSEDEYIQPQTTLVKIPKSAVLSVRSCSLAGLIPDAPYGLAAQLSLSLALYAEIVQGTKSRWHGYLQSLPEGLVDLPSFWDLGLEANTRSNSHQDVAKGSVFLRGTEAGKICNRRLETGRTQLEEVTHFYSEVAEPLLQRYVDGSDASPTLLGFYRAFSLVSSRAFLVDAYHGLAMVPVADAFNHTLDNHVHLESDYNVCSECGSLYECVHDREDGVKVPGLTNTSDEHDLYYEMVSNMAIPPHIEIFNTYGEDLTNAQLLNQYGFILDVNENDLLFWSVDDVLKAVLSEHELADESHHQRLLQDLRDVSAYLREIGFDFGQSQLIYHEASGENVFCLNSDGIMSFPLWLALFILAAWRNFPDREKLVPDIARLIPPVVELQTELELENAGNEDVMDLETDQHVRKPIRKDHDPSTLALLNTLAQYAVQLCSTRKASSGPEGFTADQLSDIIDADVAEHGGETTSTTRAGLAISVLLGERSILDSCEAAWGALGDSIQSRGLLLTHGLRCSDDRGSTPE